MALCEVNRLGRNPKQRYGSILICIVSLNPTPKPNLLRLERRLRSMFGAIARQSWLAQSSKPKKALLRKQSIHLICGKFIYMLQFLSYVRAKGRKKEEEEEEEEERRWTKSKFSCLFFSAFVWVSRTLGAFFTIEQQRLLLCEHFVWLCCGFYKVAPIP